MSIEISGDLQQAINFLFENEIHEEGHRISEGVSYLIDRVNVSELELSTLRAELDKLKVQKPVGYAIEEVADYVHHQVNFTARVDRLQDLYAHPAPPQQDGPIPMFQAACSGLWYENPMSCGEVSAVTFGVKHFALPKSEQSTAVAVPENYGDTHNWWRVEVHLYDGMLLAIEPEMLTGKNDLTDKDSETIRAAGRHLLGFAGKAELSDLSPTPPSDEAKS